MSLVKFRADLSYSSTDADHQSNFRNNENCSAPQTLINLVEHLAWMAAIGGDEDAVRKAFENGIKVGDARKTELVKLNGLKPVEIPHEICWWFHPDFKFIDPLRYEDGETGYTPEQWEQLQQDGKVLITFDTSYSIEDIEEALGRETDGEWNGWNPTPPTPDHFLIAAFDTDNCDCVLWWAIRNDLTKTEKE